MNIRLVALDLDRTLIGNAHRVSEANRQAVRWALDQGVKVIIATGRRFDSAVLYARDLGLTSPLITFGGAFTAECDQSRVYDRHLINDDLARGAMNLAASQNLFVNAYTENRVLAVNRDLVLRSGYYRSDEVEQWRSEVFGEVDGLVQVTAVGQESVEALASYAEGRFPGEYRFDVFSNLDPWAGHLLARSASKGTALSRLAQQFDVAREEVLAVGDECNDVDMIDWAGTGVAMYYATPDVHAVADDVTPQGDPDGVAAVLYHYLGEGAIQGGRLSKVPGRERGVAEDA